MSLIYHYCDVSAFMSIIQNDVLWLSSLYSMNDTAEVDYVVKKVAPAIIKVIENHGSDPVLLETFKLNMDSQHYYATCFSTESDDLYQWQAYGQKGKGFAIGFDADQLCSFKPATSVTFIDEVGSISAPQPTAAPGQSMAVCKVRYMSAAQIEEFAEQMAGYMQYALEHEKAAAESTLLEIIYRICVLCAVVKNVKFKAENEHRLLYAALLTYGAGGTRVIGDLKERKWRNGAHGITPYFEKTNVKHAIRQIVMGPNCVELTGAHINDFLISNGLPDNLLCRSEATLR